MENFRPFHLLKPTQCHRRNLLDHAGDSVQEQLKILGAPAQFGGLNHASNSLGHVGCTVLFSGFGGDQAISHNANNVPTDLVAQRRWTELVNWFGGKRRSLKPVASRWLMLTNRQLAEKLVLRRSRNFYTNNLLIRTLTLEGSQWLSPHISRAYPWEIDGYIQQHQSIRQRILADWVTSRAEEETRLANFYGVKKVFPLLDEKLISTLLKQDPALFGEGAGRGRLLHRRAFAPFLPPYLRHNPSKYRGPDGGLEKWDFEFTQRIKRALECSLLTMNSWHSNLSKYWDIGSILREAEDVLLKPSSTIKTVFETNRAVESLSSQQLVALT